MDEQNCSVYGDLSQFKDLILSIESFTDSIEAIKKFITPLLASDLYGKLTVEEKLEHDLFVAYAFSSLFWMLQKSVGLNPASSRVKAEIDRVKEHAKRFKLIKERKQMPRLDQAAARRFIRSGLWTPGSDANILRKRRRED